MGNYLDYISTESITEKEYNNIITEYIQSKDIQDFITNCLLIDSCDYGENLEKILKQKMKKNLWKNIA